MGQWMTTNKVLFDNLFVFVDMLYIFDECSSLLIITNTNNHGHGVVESRCFWNPGSKIFEKKYSFNLP